MFKPIVNFANGLGRMHGKFFMWLGGKAETSPWWSLALTLWALYEIGEHIAGPAIAVLYATGHITIQ
jgi:hypothetical protein